MTLDCSALLKRPFAISAIRKAFIPHNVVRSARKDRGYVFPTRLLSFARDCFFVGRNGLRAGPARAICPTGANSQSQQFAGRPAAASGSGLAGGPAGIAR